MTPDPTAINPEIPAQISATSERQSSSWDIRNAPRNYISLVAFQFGSALFSFASVWIITRYLGSEGYGGIVAIIAASQVAQVFVNWTSYSVTRFGVEEFVETEKIARTFWTVFIALVANLVLVAGLAPLWFPVLANWLKLSPASFWLVIIHLAVTVMWIQVQMSLQAAKLPRVQGFLQMIERLLIVSGLFALTAAAALKPTWAIVCYIAAPAAMILLGGFKLRNYIFARVSVDRAFVRRIFAYSLPLLPFSLVGYFAGSYLDAVFVSHFLTTRDLGIYSVATQISGVALQFPMLINTLLLPLFITLNKEEKGDRTNTYFSHFLPSMILLWGLFCTVCNFAAYFMLPRVFGMEFVAAASPLWVLLGCSVIPFAVLAGYGSFSNAYSKTYISLFAAISSSVVNLGLNFILVPRFGLVGCAWGTGISYVFGLAVYAFLLRLQLRMPLSWTFLAMLPAVTGVVVISVFQNPWAALLLSLAANVVLIYFVRASFWEAWRVASDLRLLGRFANK